MVMVRREQQACHVTVDLPERASALYDGTPLSDGDRTLPARTCAWCPRRQRAARDAPSRKLRTGANRFGNATATPDRRFIQRSDRASLDVCDLPPRQFSVRKDGPALHLASSAAGEALPCCAAARPSACDGPPSATRRESTRRGENGEASPPLTRNGSRRGESSKKVVM